MLEYSKKCQYQEKDKRLKENFINGINGDNLMTKIIIKLITVKKTSEISTA